MGNKKKAALKISTIHRTKKNIWVAYVTLPGGAPFTATGSSEVEAVGTAILGWAKELNIEVDRL